MHVRRSQNVLATLFTLTLNKIIIVSQNIRRHIRYISVVYLHDEP